MKYYVLQYEVVPDYLEKRARYRDEHLRLLREGHARGEILLAGAVGDPPDAALLIFRLPSSEGAEQFARRDPYVTNGLVTRWHVRPWAVVVGDDEFGNRAL